MGAVPFALAFPVKGKLRMCNLPDVRSRQGGISTDRHMYLGP